MTVLTQSEIAQHLRLGADEESAEADTLQRLADAAQDHASQYLGRPIPWQDADGNAVPVPASVKAAMLLIVGDLYENREAQVIGATVAENPTVERLLHFYREGLGL